MNKGWNFTLLFLNSWVQNEDRFHLPDWKYREFREAWKLQIFFEKKVY